MKLDILKPENFRIVVLSAEKTHELDSYEHGIQGNIVRRKDARRGVDESYPSVMHAVRSIVGDGTINPEHVGTIDPNIYCDMRGGGTKTVEDNVSRGIFRVTFDRLETARGNRPSTETEEAWKRGEGELFLARYDIQFRIEIVGIEEAPLAQLLGVSNW
jgi:hypothetical protein